MFFTTEMTANLINKTWLREILSEKLVVKVNDKLYRSCEIEDWNLYLVALDAGFTEWGEITVSLDDFGDEDRVEVFINDQMVTTVALLPKSARCAVGGECDEETDSCCSCRHNLPRKFMDKKYMEDYEQLINRVISEYRRFYYSVRG